MGQGLSTNRDLHRTGDALPGLCPRNGGEAQEGTGDFSSTIKKKSKISVLNAATEQSIDGYILRKS